MSQLLSRPYASSPRKRGGIRARLAKGIAVFAGAALVVGLAACSTPVATSPTGAPGATGKIDGGGKSLVVFMLSTADIYPGGAAKAIKKEAERLGFVPKIFENKTDQTAQDQQVQQFLATGEVPAAFIWWPSNVQAGINSSRLLSKVAPVIQMNQSVLPEGKDYITAYAGVNAVAIGEAAGKMALQARDEAVAGGKTLNSKGGNLIEITFPAGYQSGIDRHDGFEKATKDAPFNLLQSEPVQNFDAQSSFDAASSLITKFKSTGIDFVFVHNLTMAAGVVSALEQNGYTPGKDVFVICGNDAGDKALLRSGKVYSAVLQSPVIEGTLAVRTAAQYLATHKVDDKTVTLKADTEDPKLEAVAPDKTTYMPTPGIRADDLTKLRLWGLPYSDLGTS